ncbi:MAG: M16 family metallopeptidase [Sulfobacillus sp.]
MGIDHFITLPSGMSVTYDDHGSLGTIAIGIFVGVGSRDEGPHQEGMAHFLEHLTFKGAKDRNSQQIAEVMDDLGGEVNAYTTRDYTCFYAKVLTPLAPRAWQLLSDLVQHPWLRPEDAERERNVVQEELLEAMDDLEDRCEVAYMESLYADRLITHDVLGSPESIRTMDLGSLNAFYQMHYVPANMVVAIAGEGTEELVERIVKKTEPKRASLSIRHAPSPSPSHVHFERSAEQLQVLLGVPAPVLIDDAYPTALLLAMLLGGQNSSRFWQRLREKDGLVYTVSTGYNAQGDWAEMSTHMAVHPSSLNKAVNAIKSELRRFVDEGPAPQEVRRSVIQLATSFAFNRETPEGRMFRLGRYGLLGRAAENAESLLERIRQVRPDAIQRLAHTLWGDWTAVAVGTAGTLPKKLANLRGDLVE